MERHVSGSSICPGTAGGLWSHPAGFSLSLLDVLMVVFCLFMTMYSFLSLYNKSKAETQALWKNKAQDEK